MNHQPRRAFEKTMLTIIMISGWFALVAQMKLNIESKLVPLPEILTRYFSYFTLLTNLLVALVCTITIFSPQSAAGRFVTRYSTVTATTVYILLVGIVYNLVLRQIWEPTGLQKVVDELLHSVIPFLFLLYWVIYIPKQHVRATSFLPWLIYPLVYIIFILTRGSFSDFYPYPFVNLSKLSWQQVMINCVAIALAVALLSITLIFIGNRLANKKGHQFRK
jgi:hypothetical protein